MYTLITIVHVLVSLLLIAIVLFQAEEGDGLSGAFGTAAGGSSGGGRMFGKKGAAGAVARFTSGLVAVFMVTSFVLTLMVSKGYVERDNFGPRTMQVPPASR